MAKKTIEYGNDSIKKLDGPDRVRKRPAVIFGSDGLDGCEHSVFEIISNSIDEAREGYGKLRLRTSEEVVRLITTKKKNAITGNLYFANCMPEVNIILTMAITMNIR